MLMRKVQSCELSEFLNGGCVVCASRVLCCFEGAYSLTCDLRDWASAIDCDTTKSGLTDRSPVVSGVLRSCSQTQVVFLAIQSIAVFMIHAGSNRSVDNEPMQINVFPIASGFWIPFRCTHSVNAWAIFFLDNQRAPLERGYPFVVIVIHERDVSFGERNFSHRIIALLALTIRRPGISRTPDLIAALTTLSLSCR